MFEILIVLLVSVLFFLGILGSIYFLIYLEKRKNYDQARSLPVKINIFNFLYILGIIIFGGWFLASFTEVQQFLEYNSHQKLIEWRFSVLALGGIYYIIIFICHQYYRRVAS